MNHSTSAKTIRILTGSSPHKERRCQTASWGGQNSTLCSLNSCRMFMKSERERPYPIQLIPSTSLADLTLADQISIIF